MQPPILHPDGPRRILVVDDSVLDRLLVRNRLGLEDVEILEAAGGATGLEAARERRPDLILLDLHLPDADGRDLIRDLVDDPRTRGIPLIVLSHATDSAEKAHCLDLGAVDFVSKPFDPVELRARVGAALRAKRLQDLLEQRAHLDGLTGLGNRLALDERLAAEAALCRRRGCPMAVWIADLDRFKAINDRFGHAAGDEVLRLAAAALRATARAGDFVARFGGEEFVVLAPDSDQAGAVAMAERFRAELAGMEVTYRGSRIAATVSVGVAAASGPRLADPVELINHADLALYCAKAGGRNAVWAWDCARHMPVAAAGPGEATPWARAAGL